MQQRTWQVLVKQGNHSFARKDWLEANQCYTKAFEILTRQCHQSPSCMASLIAWIGVCHNLADLFQQQADLDCALRFLQLPYQYCKQKVELEVDDEIKLTALNAMNLAWSALSMFCKKHPQFAQDATRASHQLSKATSSALLH